MILTHLVEAYRCPECHVPHGIPTGKYATCDYCGHKAVAWKFLRREVRHTKVKG